MKGDIAYGLFPGWMGSQGLVRMVLVMPLDTRYGKPLIAFPLVAPMGWVESPLFLVDLSETAADLVNAYILSGFHPRPH